MTVAEARTARVCRICGEPIPISGGVPKGWESEFGQMTYPLRITLDFGEEFAHTDCLEVEPGQANRPR